MTISFDLKTAAERCGLSTRALRYAIDEGALTAHYYGTKPLIHAEDLDTYIKSLPNSPQRRVPAEAK